MKWIFSRLREPSTWAGLATIASFINPAAGLTVKTIGGLILGGAAVVLPEAPKQF